MSRGTQEDSRHEERKVTVDTERERKDSYEKDELLEQMKMK